MVERACYSLDPLYCCFGLLKSPDGFHFELAREQPVFTAGLNCMADVESRQWITHNCHAHENLDFGRIARDLDLVAWDPYLGDQRLDGVIMGPVLDFARGLMKRNFWVIETQPGSVNWARINRTMDKGEVRRLVWHCIGHGSDAVLFWQWRSALGGQEQYHGCVVAPDGTPRPLYTELAVLAGKWRVSPPCSRGRPSKLRWR